MSIVRACVRVFDRSETSADTRICYCLRETKHGVVVRPLVLPLGG